MQNVINALLNTLSVQVNFGFPVQNIKINMLQILLQYIVRGDTMET